MNCCDKVIIEREPQRHSNASGVVIIGEEDSISFSSSKGNELVNTQGSAAYKQEAYEGGQLWEKACHLKNYNFLTEPESSALAPLLTIEVLDTTWKIHELEAVQDSIIELGSAVSVRPRYSLLIYNCSSWKNCLSVVLRTCISIYKKYASELHRNILVWSLHFNSHGATNKPYTRQWS